MAASHSGRRSCQLPHARIATSGTRSWPGRPSCHWQRALGRRHRRCSLVGSALSVSVGASSATIVESNITAACGAGSRADSPDSRTLGYPSSWCSLLDFIDAPRCARHTASNQPAHRGPSAAADGVAAPPACLTDSWSCVRAQAPAFVAAPPSSALRCRHGAGLGPATPQGPASRVTRADVA